MDSSGWVTSNDVWIYASGMIIANNSSIITVDKSTTSLLWTASGTKGTTGQLIYEF